jgi:hypothetical protein
MRQGIIAQPAAGVKSEMPRNKQAGPSFRGADDGGALEAVKPNLGSWR